MLSCDSSGSKHHVYLQYYFSKATNQLDRKVTFANVSKMAVTTMNYTLQPKENLPKDVLSPVYSPESSHIAAVATSLLNLVHFSSSSICY